MLDIRRNAQGRMERLEAPEPGCWVHVVAPTDADLDVARRMGVPNALLDHVTDVDERPRVEHVGDVVLVVLNYPARREEGSGPPWRTVPVSVLLTPLGVVTIAPGPTPFLTELLDGRTTVAVGRASEFVLRMCWLLADSCLTALREINSGVDTLEQALKRSLRNEEVLGLLDFQKSLTYFATGMKSNELVLERLQRIRALSWESQEQELLDDVRIEVRQTIEMVEISDNILSQMMDAYASIVSNNLNSVMKVLTSVTIMLAVPTLVASVYGMNVALPGAHGPWAFAVILALCVAVGAVLFVVFRRRNWL